MRWPRFSLRTLFVVVTLIAVAMWWLVREWNLTEARKAALADINARQGGYFMQGTGQLGALYGRQPSFREFNIGIDESFNDPKSQPDPSFVRRWMGDQTIRIIWIPNGMPAANVEAVRSLFPEATLEVVGPEKP